MGEYVNPSNREFASAGPDPYQNQCHVIFLNMQTFYPIPEMRKNCEGYLKNLLLVGISYNRKTKKHECHIEKYEE